MLTLDESIISEIQKQIKIKEDKIAELEEESFSQIFLILEEINNKFKPKLSEIKSKFSREKAAELIVRNDEYKRIIKEKKASINVKLKEIVNHRDKKIKGIKKEIDKLNKELKVLNIIK